MVAISAFKYCKEWKHRNEQNETKDCKGTTFLFFFPQADGKAKGINCYDQ